MMQTLLVTILAVACLLCAFGLYGAILMSARVDAVADTPALAHGGTPPGIRVEPQLSIVLPDDELHHWGEVYTANPQLRRAGVLFSTFVRHPEQILQAIALRSPSLDAEPEPDAVVDDISVIPARDAFGLDSTTCDDIHPARLVAEAETQLARDAFGPRLRYRDGAYVEPLHHHRVNGHAGTRQHRPWRLTGAR